MAKRNQEDAEEKRQQIIGGALEAFSAKGFEQATNKDIADAAGIGSAGLIYHYFKDKADLLRNVVEQRIGIFQMIAHPDQLNALPIREGLERIAMTVVHAFTQPDAAKLMRVMLGEAARRPQTAQIFAEFGPNKVLPYIAGYLEHQMDAGAIRRTDPMLAARSFMGPIIIFAILRNVLQQTDALSSDPDTIARHAVDNFLLGLLPRDTDGSDGDS